MARMYMCPEHPQWLEFRHRLTGREGCQFRWTDGRHEDPEWTCHGDHTKAREILKKMNCEVEASIEYFKSVGGFCDCDILLNVGIN